MWLGLVAVETETIAHTNRPVVLMLKSEPEMARVDLEHCRKREEEREIEREMVLHNA